MGQNMRLNLGCGNDYIEGYINIDAQPINQNIIQGDFRQLDKLGIVDNTIEEIRAFYILEYIHFKIFPDVFGSWVAKLKQGGVIEIKSIHAGMLTNKFAHNQISLEELKFELNLI